MRVVFVCIALWVGGCRGGSGHEVADGGLGNDADFDPYCPGTQVAQGLECAPTQPYCLSGQDVCDLMMICRCEEGRFECEPIDFEAPCELPTGASCAVEGTGRCDLSPAGGVWTCDEGIWRFDPGCPEECPEVAPTTPSTCALDPGAICRYADSTCSCRDGELECCSGCS